MRSLFGFIKERRSKQKLQLLGRFVSLCQYQYRFSEYGMYYKNLPARLKWWALRPVCYLVLVWYTMYNAHLFEKIIALSIYLPLYFYVNTFLYLAIICNCNVVKWRTYIKCLIDFPSLRLVIAYLRGARHWFQLLLSIHFPWSPFSREQLSKFS